MVDVINSLIMRASQGVLGKEGYLKITTREQGNS